MKQKTVVLNEHLGQDFNSQQNFNSESTNTSGYDIPENNSYEGFSGTYNESQPNSFSDTVDRVQNVRFRGRVQFGTRRKKSILPFAIMFIFTGIMILFVYTNNNNYYNKMIKNCTASANGIVKSVRQDVRTSRKKVNKHYQTTKTTYYIPTIEFSDGNITVNTEAQSTTSSSAYLTGDSVTVMYNPTNSQEIYVKGKLSKPSKTFSYLGYFFLGTGGLMMIGFVIKKVKRG